MLRKKYEDFIVRYIYLDKNATTSSNQIYHLFCAVYDIKNNELNIKTFIPRIKIHIEDHFKVKIERSKKRVGNTTVRGLRGIGISFKEASFVDDTLNKRSTTQDKTPDIFNTNLLQRTAAHPTTHNKIDDTFDDTARRAQKTQVTIVDFIEKYYEKGDSSSILASDEIYSLCKEYYKTSPLHTKYISSKTHFTQKFKKSWDLLYPDHPLQTDNIRDPQDRKKRGIAFIKKKGS